MLATGIQSQAAERTHAAPCVRCGTTGGTRDKRRSLAPVRTHGGRYGINGLICGTCRSNLFRLECAANPDLVPPDDDTEHVPTPKEIAEQIRIERARLGFPDDPNHVKNNQTARQREAAQRAAAERADVRASRYVAPHYGHRGRAVAVMEATARARAPLGGMASMAAIERGQHFAFQGE